jgi:hypothetical protein
MTTEAKMLLLAQQDPTLQSIFFTGGQMRWFDRKLQPGLSEAQFHVRALPADLHGPGCTPTKPLARAHNASLAMVRFQIDVLDFSAERARAAKTAIIDWLATVDFSSGSSVCITPHLPNATPEPSLRLWPAGMEYTTDPPAFTESLDVRIFDLEA